MGCGCCQSAPAAAALGISEASLIFWVLGSAHSSNKSGVGHVHGDKKVINTGLMCANIQTAALIRTYGEGR